MNKNDPWDNVQTVGILLTVAGFALYIVTPAVFVAGILILAACAIANIRRAIKDPLRCPECGAVLSASGARIRTGGLFAKRRDMITCVNCGATVDLLELYEKMKRRHRWQGIAARNSKH